MKDYFVEIYKMRYFWWHLAKMDLVARFRRSKLGLLWGVFQPFFLTIVMAVVFSTVFRQPLGSYLLYILSGMVVWDLLTNSVIGGAFCLLNSEQYIRQFKHPITIYTLRYGVLNTILFLIELIALVIWCVIYNPENLFIALFTIPLTTILLFLLSWTLTTFAGYTHTKYRDYPQIMQLLMQAIWYLSPVFFREEMFTSNRYLALLFRINPLTHLLNIVRRPFLDGIMPSFVDYCYTIVVICIFGLVAWLTNKRNEEKIIFYF